MSVLLKSMKLQQDLKPIQANPIKSMCVTLLLKRNLYLASKFDEWTHLYIAVSLSIDLLLRERAKERDCISLLVPINSLISSCCPLLYMF